MRKTLLATAAVALALPSSALAHVTVQPTTAPAGAFTRLDVRVPNERDDASTEKVELQLPDGFVFASYEPAAGWDTEVTRGPLQTPIQTDDGEITEGVTKITWTASDEEDAIPPNAFRDFGLSVQVPGKAGDKLEFKALQTYTGGEVVRWIGAEGSDNPAAIVTVTAAEEGDDAGSHSAAEGEAPEGHNVDTAPTPATSAAAASSDDGSSNGLAIIALIVGALGLLAGGAALLSARSAAKA